MVVMPPNPGALWESVTTRVTTQWKDSHGRQIPGGLQSNGRFNDVYDEARVAITNRVIELAPKADTKMLVRLADAFAWVASPAQNHGGTSLSE